jgi:serine/threonine protein kinase
MAEFEPIRFGKYQLIERIAIGGMAEVYKAKSYGVAGFEKLLVIKKILPHLSRNPEFVQMFINEAKIAVSLNHANIVQVYDLGVVDKDFYMAMEFIHGHDLMETIK